MRIAKTSTATASTNLVPRNNVAGDADRTVAMAMTVLSAVMRPPSCQWFGNPPFPGGESGKLKHVSRDVVDICDIRE